MMASLLPFLCALCALCGEMLSFSVAGETLHLLPAKAAFWPAARTLFVADPHWGKAAAFLAGGLAVPQATTAADLARLDACLDSTDAARLVVLGDLFHAKAGRTPAVLTAVAAWRATRPALDVLVIRGNHDRHAGDPPPEWGFRVESEPVADGPFAYRHFPDETPGLYTLAGHVHPAVTLFGRGRQRLTLPCFAFGGRVGLLPAFGGFTGTAAVRPRPGDLVFAIADGEVVAVG